MAHYTKKVFIKICTPYPQVKLMLISRITKLEKIANKQPDDHFNLSHLSEKELEELLIAVKALGDNPDLVAIQNFNAKLKSKGIIS